MNTDAQALRAAILAAPLETSNFGETPEAGTLYVPPSHLKALRLDAPVVVGARGVGKSFWAAVLHSDGLRGLLGGYASDLAEVSVRLGFAQPENIAQYPNADGFQRFIGQGGDPYDLWRTVILRWVAEKSGKRIPDDSWMATVWWLQSDPEAAARLMQEPRNWRGLILFDALDRTSDDWQRLDDIVRGLLRAVLWLKPFRGLHAKVFLREDQAARNVFNFPDASKLRTTQVELSWVRHDLHGLLWQRLINAPAIHGERMRAICPHSERAAGVWRVADEMRVESEAQREAFQRLAGPWMGRDRRRGVPYTWLVRHLADGQGRTTPRAFLAAIRQAAEDSSERYEGHALALHHESLKCGVQKAAEVRIREVAEEYPWVPDVLSALKGLRVPCDPGAVVARWQDRFPDGPQTLSQGRLPAQHAARGWVGLLEDLQRLGILETHKDREIDVPEVYRVGLGLGRRSCVKPEN